MTAEQVIRVVRDAIVQVVDRSNASMVAGMREAGYSESDIVMAIAEYWARDGLRAWEAPIRQMAQMIDSVASEHERT